MRKHMQEINHPEIERLLSDLFLQDEIEMIRNIYAQYRLLFLESETVRSRDQATDELRKSVSPLERKIGGIGYDELLYGKDGTRYSGNYPAADRAIYRPLQYALRDLLYLGNSRNSIRESCAHLEGLLKRRYSTRIKNILRKPLGSITHSARKDTVFSDKLLVRLQLISEIGNIAKHDYGLEAVTIEASDELQWNLDSKVFSDFEGLAMYFVCRKVGVDLMRKIWIPGVIDIKSEQG